MIEIINQQKRYQINKNRFKDLLDQLIRHYKLDSPTVTLAFVENKKIKQLNRDFRQKDAPTDVLSFFMGEDGPDGVHYLGDIIISPAIAMKQCLRKTHGLEREIEILTIHGFHHLLGYEHDKDIEGEDERIRAALLEGYDGY